jgi:hypothetical protein
MANNVAKRIENYILNELAEEQFMGGTSAIASRSRLWLFRKVNDELNLKITAGVFNRIVDDMKHLGLLRMTGRMAPDIFMSDEVRREVLSRFMVISWADLVAENAEAARVREGGLL